MNKYLVTPSAIILFALAGCDTPESANKEDFSGSYELVEEVEFDHHWASVRRLKIRGEGTRSITISGVGVGGGGITLSPNGDPANEIMMTFTVDPGKRVATWWITHYSRDPDGGMSGRAGSPRSFKYSENGKYLTDVVEFLDVEGHHKLGEKVPLVRFIDAAAAESEIAVTVK